MSNFIALKSLNQYRKRDILAYLSLRYYLEPKSSQSDYWAHEVAIKLALKKNSSKLLKVKHFKGLSEGKLQFRDIYILSPNDIIAESALISQCSKYKEFHTNSAVYSYLINNDNRSIFQHYTNGLKKRYSSIQEACKKKENDEIIYLDIQSFYPSIELKRLKEIWLKTCSKTNLQKKYISLGLSLIKKFEIEQKENSKPGLLIGPMFSHLLANLFLKDLDDYMQKKTENRYWRYVDDIVLIGSKKEVDKFSKKLETKLKSLGLTLHEDKKYFRLKTNDWLNNENPVSSQLSKKWSQLIGEIKRLAIFYPERINEFRKILDDMQVRFEVLEYSQETKSKSISTALYNWIQRTTFSKVLSPQIIASNIENLRTYYLVLFYKTLAQKKSNELEYKGKITKLKYLVGRLIYLATEKQLKLISPLIKPVPELHIQYEIINALLTKDISNIINLGTNASQATAQVIKNTSQSLSCTLDPLDGDVIAALSIFKLHGINIKFVNNEKIENSFYDFAVGNIKSARKTRNSYLQEFVALHGNEESRHTETLNTLFDENETLSFDVLNTAAGSSYYFN